MKTVLTADTIKGMPGIGVCSRYAATAYAPSCGGVNAAMYVPTNDERWEEEREKEEVTKMIEGERNNSYHLCCL